MFLNTILLWGFSFANTQKVLSYSIYYHPLSNIKIGNTFDKNYPESGINHCLSHDGIQPLGSREIKRTIYTLMIIKSRKELFNLLSISSFFSAKDLLWHINDEVIDFKIHFDSDTLNWIIFGLTELGNNKIKNPKLNSAIQNLSKTNNWAEIEKRCGTEFINEERNGIIVATVFTLSNLSKTVKSSLEKTFTKSINTLKFNNLKHNKYSTFYAKAAKMGKIEASVYFIEKNRVRVQPNSILPLDSLNKVKNFLKSNLETMSLSPPPTLEYVSSPLRTLGIKIPFKTRISTQREIIIGDLYHEYKNNYLLAQRLHEILINSDSPLYSFLSEKTFNRYSKQFDSLIERSKIILIAIQKCFSKATNCSPVQFNEIIQVKFLIEYAEHCEQERLKGYFSGIITLDDLVRERKNNTYPFSQVGSNLPATELNCSHLKN